MRIGEDDRLDCALGELTRADIAALISLVSTVAQGADDMVALLNKLEAIRDEMTEADDVIGRDYDEAEEE
jgi:hypothetical protein